MTRQFHERINGLTIATIVLSLYCASAFSPATRTRIIRVPSIRVPSSKLYSKQAQAQAQPQPIINIPEIETATNFSHDFASSKAWGTHPILMRNAFKIEALSLTDNEESPWPGWDEVMMLASDEDAESRLITHDSTDANSWCLELGPIDRITTKDKWTVVVNDVDRFHPPLSEWIGNTFAMIPQWRRDDGQISLSDAGGGIGSHVDDYDVFLIQMAGTRRWVVGKRIISSREEIEGLIPGLDVRVLDFWDDDVEKGLVDTVTLQPGDVLYLPPRFGHCGTALTDGCMTLSVGLRAPSAKEMMTKMMDHVADAVDGNVLARYKDPNLLDNIGHRAGNDLNNEVKLKGKELVRNAMNAMLDDDLFFDEFFGKLVTESKRLRFDYPPSLEDLDSECKEELGKFGDAKSAIEAVKNGDGVLYAAEGVAWAYSELDGKICRLFIDGYMWEIELDSHDDSSTMNLIKRLVDERQISQASLDTKSLSSKMIDLLEKLVFQGYLYGSNE